MGPDLLIALGTMAAGTAVSAAADRRADKDRRNILNRSMERSAETTAKATDQVLSEARKYSPDQRLEDMRLQEESNVAQAQKDGATPGAVPTAAQGAGKAISLGDADKALAEGNRMTAIARELARVRAPNQLAANDNMRRAGMTSDIGSMWSDNRAQANGASLDAQNVKAPWWGTLGKMAQTVGMGMAGGALMPATAMGSAAGAKGLASGMAGGAGAGYGGINWGP